MLLSQTCGIIGGEIWKPYRSPLFFILIFLNDISGIKIVMDKSTLLGGERVCMCHFGDQLFEA